MWRSSISPLREPLADHRLQDHRQDDDQAVDQLRPEAGKADRHDAGVDGADDERGHERAEHRPDPPKTDESVFNR